VIGLDSNVLVRYFAQDDPDQASVASDVIDGLSAEQPGHVTLIALIELNWVLKRAYGAPTDVRMRIIHGLLDARDIRVQHADSLRRALQLVGGGVDLSDALLTELSAGAGCSATVTFDRRMSKLPGVRLLV
jgi:predicted nucleic-acid-binding protein